MTKNVVELNDTEIDLTKIVSQTPGGVNQTEKEENESSGFSNMHQSSFSAQDDPQDEIVSQTPGLQPEPGLAPGGVTTKPLLKHHSLDIREQMIQQKFRSLIEKAKTPQQLKKEQIANEAPEARRLRLLILNRYKLSERFGQYLAELGFKLDNYHLNNFTIPELDSLINDIRFCVSTKNVNNFWQDACTQGVGIAERIVSPFYNVTGLSAVLSQDESYKDVCEELILEHQHYLYCKPEYRLLYSVVKNATIVHQQHKFFQSDEGKKAIEEYKKKMGLADAQPNQPVPEKGANKLNISPRNLPNIENKYADLLA